MENMDKELRNLMNLYLKRYNELETERQESKQDKDYDRVDTIDVLQKLCKKMIAELFQTMEKLGILDEEEIAFGGIKNK